MQSLSKESDASVQLQSLTPLRGIAALWVVLYHYAVLYLPSLHPENYTQLLDKGYLAVDLFFILSGFVLAHVYHDAFVRAAGACFWKFLFARIARLYPLHLFVLSLFVATEIADRAAQYAETGNFELIPLEGAQSFTALIFKLALGIILLCALAWLAYWTKDNFNQWDGPKTMLRCLPEFIFGMLLYNLYKDAASPSIMRRDVVLLSIVLGLVLLLHVGAPDLLIIVLFPVLILAAVRNTGYVASLINARLLKWLGDVSYSLYLIHGFVQFVTTKLLTAYSFGDRTELSSLSSFALTVGMVSASLLSATITYYAVEKVGRRYLRSVFGVRSAIRLQKSPPIRPQNAYR